MAAAAFGQEENIVCSVTATNGGNTKHYQNFAEAADAANSIEGGALITLNADVSGISSTVALGSADGVMLNLNGHSIVGDIDLNDDIAYAYADAIIHVGSGKKLNIVNDESDGKICNVGTDGTGIYNEGELSVLGASVETMNIGIENDGGTLGLKYSIIKAAGSELANCVAVRNTAGNVFVTSSTFIADGGRHSIGIDNHGAVTLNDWPQFSITGDKAFDIGISGEGYIAFGDYCTARPYSPIKVFIPKVNTDKCTFTKGYDEKVIDEYEDIIDPANVFSVVFSPIYGNYDNAIVALEDGEVVAYPAAYVTIGESMRGYGSFSNALAAASNAEEAATIKLMKDFGTADFGGTACSIGSQAGVTLDLNGHTLQNDRHGNVAFEVENGKKLTVSDTSGGGVICNRGDYATVILNYGSLTIDGGTISSGDANHASYGNCSTIHSPQNGDVTINGGTIEAIGAGSYCIVQADGNVMLNTCTAFKGTGRQSDIHLIGNGRIEPGSDVAASLTKPVAVSTTNALPFTFTNDYRRNLEDENGHLIAPDKVFTVSHYNNSTFDDCPVAYSGGEVTAYSPGTVAIVSSGSVTTEYDSFGDAVNAANNAKDGNNNSVAATISLIKDIDETTDLKNYFDIGSTAGVTLDLCGHHYNAYRKNDFIVVSENMKLTITDSFDGGVLSNCVAYVINNSGTLNMEGGKVFSNGATTGISNFAKGTLILRGGTIHAVGGQQCPITNKGTLKVEGNVVISNEGDNGSGLILNTGSLNFAAMPKFQPGGTGTPDINLENGNIITVSGNIADGLSRPVIVKRKNTALGTITNGYATYVKDGDGNVIPASEVFALSGAADNVVTVVNAAGEVTFVEQPAPLTFATAGYATYYNSQFAIALPAGMRAYTVTACSEADAKGVSTLTYDLIADGDDSNAGANMVPAATAVLLSIDPSVATATVSFTDNTKKAPVNNLLRGYDYSHLTEGGDVYYKLTYGTDEYASVFGWYYSEENGEAFECAPHKAYLALPANAARFLALPSDDANGIVPALSMVNSQLSFGYFTLDGRRLGAKPAKPGIYVRNGKKVVVR